MLDQEGGGEAGRGLGLERCVGHPGTGEGILNTGAEEGREPMTRSVSSRVAEVAVKALFAWSKLHIQSQVFQSSWT